jgi:hypothetical protein
MAIGVPTASYAVDVATSTLRRSSVKKMWAYATPSVQCAALRTTSSSMSEPLHRPTYWSFSSKSAISAT